VEAGNELLSTFVCSPNLITIYEWPYGVRYRLHGNSYPVSSPAYRTILNAGSRSSPQPMYLSYFPRALSLLIFAQ
jgi:hypothetical protein